MHTVIWYLFELHRLKTNYILKKQSEWYHSMSHVTLFIHWHNDKVQKLLQYISKVHICFCSSIQGSKMNSHRDSTNCNVKNWGNMFVILILENKGYIPIKSSDNFQDSFFHLFKGNIFHVWIGGPSWFRSWGSEIIHDFLQFENKIAFKLRPLNPA